MITSFRGDYWFLSNFSLAVVDFEGITFTSVEAAFQAAKTLDIEERKRFTRYQPGEAKKEGRKLKLRSDWEEVKDDIMYKLVYAKFSNVSLGYKDKLLKTGDEYIREENTWGDRYWGTCNGIGQNKLGKILMRVREELRAEDNKKLIIKKQNKAFSDGINTALNNLIESGMSEEEARKVLSFY